MALTDFQKHEIVRLLGWSGKSLIEGSLDYNTVMVSRLNNLNSHIEGQVITLLDRIEVMDQKLEKAMSRAAVKIIGDITLNENEFYLLRKERKKLLKELSDLLGIEIIGSVNGMMSVCV